MPQYKYPLRLSKMVSRIAISTSRIEVVDHNGVVLFFGRAKWQFSSVSSIHVSSPANAGEKETERYQILAHSEKGVEGEFRFVSSTDRRPVGKILLHGRNKMVLMDISDPYGKLVASAAVNWDGLLRAVMKSFLSFLWDGPKKAKKEVLATFSSLLQFRSASQAPIFSLVPLLDTNGGSMQLTPESPDVSAEHEQCILLSAITIMGTSANT